MFFARMRLHKGFVIDIEVLYSLAESSIHIVMPRPPSLWGRENKSRLRSLGGTLPVRVGINIDWIICYV